MTIQPNTRYQAPKAPQPLPIQEPWALLGGMSPVTFMKEYWQKKKQEPLKQLKTNLQQQVAKYCNRFNAYRANINKLENPTPAQHAMLRQHSENYAQAKQIRDSLIKQLQEGKDIDPQILIATLLKPTERSNT
jgi:hypothetical protein